MKNILYTLLALCLSTSLMAQTPKLKINEILYNDVLRPSIELEMTPSTKDAKKAWKDYIEDKYDADVDGFGFLTNKDILTSAGAEVTDISERKIDLYSKFVRDGDITKMNVFGSFGYDSFFTAKDNPSEFYAMQDVVKEFVASFLPNYFEDVVEETRDDVEDAADNVADLEGQIEDNKEKINDLSKENIQLTEELAQAREMLSKTKKELSADKRKLERVKDKVSNNGSSMK